MGNVDTVQVGDNTKITLDAFVIKVNGRRIQVWERRSILDKIIFDKQV